MFFIVGLTTRTATVGSGEVFCSVEGGVRPSRRVRARRWVTLFFLPLIPLGRQGEWVQCMSCGARYEPEVVQQYQAPRQG